jgi:hypothetical protein
MPQSLSTRLHLEFLESRSVPAGNVMVNVNNGVLNVIGDNEGNRIQIVQPNPFSLIIRPGDTSTQINGHLSTITIITGGVSKINIDLRGGDDVLQISPGGGLVVFNAPVFINTGTGNDSVLIEDIIAHNHFFIDTGNQNDTVLLRAPATTLQFDRNVTILTGQGFDIVTIQNTVIRGSLMITTAQQNDQVRILSSVVGGDFFANLGDGSDMIILNQLEVRGQAFISGSAGSDFVQIARGQFDFSLRINTAQPPGFFSADNDTVTIGNTQVAGETTISTGRGADFVRLRDFNFFNARVIVDLGEDNDSLEFAFNDFQLGMIADGGLGADTFVDLGSNTGLVQLKRFFP